MAERTAVSTVEPQLARRARFAVNVVFVIHGVMFASWSAHIPQVEGQLGIGDGQLGIGLLGESVGSVTATLLAGVVLARFGSRRVVRVSAIGYCLAGVLVGLSRSLPELFGALAVWGLFAGGLDVAMNTQAINVERALGRPIMGKLHGSWSVGSLVGAGIGVVAVASGITLTWQLLTMGVVAVTVAVVLINRLLDDPAHERHHHTARRRRRPSATLLILGAIAFAGLLTEGGTGNWSAVYLRETLHAQPAIAGLAYTAFTLMMVAVRLLGARLLRRFSPRHVISVCAAIATVGLGAALAIGNPIAGIIGFGLLGIGLASIIPMVFSAAGNQPDLAAGTAVATVSAVGWIGFMIGPPLIGQVAAHSSLSIALILFPLLTGFVAIAAPRIPALDLAKPPDPSE
jgi:MFS family permease